MIPNSVALKYKSVQVSTCSPGGLLVLLYQGLVRFAGEAAVAMRAGDRARAGEKLDRAHGILGELLAGLRPAEAPELCERLQGIYVFCMGHLVEANLHQDPSRIDAVVRILTPLRDAFVEAVRTVDTANG
jgi:flagellar secretion chaperone FliS